MNTISIDSNIYMGAERYAKLHNISLQQLVEDCLRKFQDALSSKPISEVDTEKNSQEKDDFLSKLSPSLMQGLAEYAVKEHRNGRCLTQEEVEASIMEEMGWN